MSTPTNHEYMMLALQLAERGRCTVSPNPMVGCVIVKNNMVIGQGYHQRAGEAHAEVYALREAGTEARDAIAYVTLEPCCHQGRTPPCSQALIDAGIKKVIVACLDPNPLVAGKGIIALQQAGIQTEVGICEEQAHRLNEIFFHYIKNKTPFVISKWSMSLDGKTTTHPDDFRVISSSESQKHAHQIREQVDAIMIGSGTAIHDDPLLTVRMTDTLTTKQPVRIILSSNGNLPLNLRLFDSTLPGKTMVVTTSDASQKQITALKEMNVEVLVIKKNSSGKIHLPDLLTELGKREISSVLVEGGMTLHADFFKENLVNKVNVYIAPVIIGLLEQKHHINMMNVTNINTDLFVSADYQEKSHV